MPSGPLVSKLAAALVEGEEVDWSGAERRASDGRERDIVRHLRLLAAVAEASGVRYGPAGEALRVHSRVQADASALALAGLCVAQLLLGTAGFMLGSPDEIPVVAAGAAGVMLAFALASGALYFSGRNDSRAVRLALFFLLVGVSMSHRFVDWLTPLAPGLTAPLAGVYADAFLAWALWRFIREFPRAVRFSSLDRFLGTGQRLAGVVGLLLFLINILLARFPTLGTTPLSALGRTQEGDLYWASLISLSLAAVLLAVVRARVAEEPERRRLRLFVTGLALGVVPISVQILLELISDRYDQFINQPEFRRASSVIFYALLASVPFTTAYAILAHRVLDVRLAARSVLRFKLTRFALLAIVTVPFAYLLHDLYVNRARPLTETVSGPRGLTITAVFLLGIISLAMRHKLLGWLGRDLARRGRPLEDLLLDLAEQLRSAPDAYALADRIGDRLRRGLGVETAHVMLRRNGLIEPIRFGARSLNADSACWWLVRRDASPICVDPESRGSLFTLLPAEDRLWVVDAAVSLLVPVGGRDGSAIGLLAISSKSSGEAWSRQDRALLMNVAGSLALALENERIRSGASKLETSPEANRVGRQCDRCQRFHPSATRLCPCGGATRPASIPCVLQGKYRIEEMIGRGGMGVVYRAFDLTLERQVAVKTLPQLGARAALRLRREARAMAAVSHPNLALIYGAESWRGTPILVLEYLAGGTLAQRLADGPLPVASALALGVVLVSALDCMHTAGLLHRDIKPSNIGFTGEDTPKLLDFGLALLNDPQRDASAAAASKRLLEATTTSLTEDGMIVGTPLYLSPEALCGGTDEPRNDLWALCVVLYEAVAGVNPFRATTVNEVLERIRAAEVPDLRGWRPECHASVAAFFVEALARERERRPHTTGELSARLRALVQISSVG